MTNFWYLFIAYTVMWTAIFVCIVHLSRQNRALQEQLRTLQHQVDRLVTPRDAPYPYGDRGHIDQ